VNFIIFTAVVQLETKMNGLDCEVKGQGHSKTTGSHKHFGRHFYRAACNVDAVCM